MPYSVGDRTTNSVTSRALVEAHCTWEEETEKGFLLGESQKYVLGPLHREEAKGLPYP